MEYPAFSPKPKPAFMVIKHAPDLIIQLWRFGISDQLLAEIVALQDNLDQSPTVHPQPEDAGRVIINGKHDVGQMKTGIVRRLDDVIDRSPGRIVITKA